jgi:hypothetical protein
MNAHANPLLHPASLPKRNTNVIYLTALGDRFVKIRIAAFAATALALALGSPALAGAMGTAKPSPTPHAMMTHNSMSSSHNSMSNSHNSMMMHSPAPAMKSSHMSNMSGHSNSMMKSSPKPSPSSHP